MSSFLCFICHSTVNKETNEETREKYREVVGINLCPDSQLCYICCHVLNKLSLFRSICLKRSLEYPVLFREKGTVNLQRSDLEIHVLCPEDCNQYQRSKVYQFSYSSDCNDTNYNNDNEYVKLEHENVFRDYFDQCQYQNVENNKEVEDNFHYNSKIDEANDIHLPENNDNNEDLVNDDTVCIYDDFNDNNDSKDSLSENTNETKHLEQIENNVNNEMKIHKINEDSENNDNDIEKDDKDIDIVDKSENNDDKTKSKDSLKKKKCKKSKVKGFKKIILSIEEQKAELEANRKEKKYLESEFKCYNCALGFLFKDTYQAHMMRHEESNGEHQCATCTLRFASLPLLRAHAATHAERHECCACGASVRPRAQRTHACVGGARAHCVACHLCGSLFRDANGLQQHVRRVHTSKTSGRMHSCGVCGDSFNTHAALRTHMIKHVKRTFSCSQCSAKYSSPYTLAQHERAHSAPPRAHRCACGATYSTRKSLMAHKRNTMNHQQTLLECPMCRRACPSQRSLAAHVQRVHSASEHACPACPAAYTTRKSLARHLRQHDAPPAPRAAVCHLCGGSFKGNNKLNRHLREVCEKAKLEEQMSSLYE